MLFVPQNFIPQSSAQFFASKLFFIENFRFWFSCSAEGLILPPKPRRYDQSEVWADWRLIGRGAVAEYKSGLKIVILRQLNDFFIYIFGDILTKKTQNEGREIRWLTESGHCRDSGRIKDKSKECKWSLSSICNLWHQHLHHPHRFRKN